MNPAIAAAGVGGASAALASLALIGIAAAIHWAARRAWTAARNQVLLRQAAAPHTWDLLLAQVMHEHRTGGQR